MGSRARRLRFYAEKWAHYNDSSLPWNRLAIHAEFMRRESFVRFPVDGNLLKALREGRFVLGRHTVVQSGVFIDVLGLGQLRIGDHTLINREMMILAYDSVTIGHHCLFGRGCFVADNDHRYDDPVRPVAWQGLVSKGPVDIGDNVWCGVHVAVLGGVKIGERCVVGAGSVVTTDLPAHTICAGVPARPIREIDYSEDRLPLVDLGGGWR